MKIHHTIRDGIWELENDLDEAVLKQINTQFVDHINFHLPAQLYNHLAANLGHALFAILK